MAGRIITNPAGHFSYIYQTINSLMNTPNNSEVFTDYSLEQSKSHTASKSFMANVFLWMFGALLISALFAYLFSTNDQLLGYLINEKGQRNSLGTLVMFAPLGLVILMSFGFNRLSFPVLGTLFIVYSIVTGISLSYIFLYYQIGSVIGCFVSAGAMFGVMGVMGYTTNKDLTGFGSILMMGLIGLVIATLINRFIGSAQFQFILSFFGIAIFTGLTAYDVQKLKRIGAGLEYEDIPAANVRKLSVMGALNLYLDFINIFLYLLRLFGRRR